MRFNPLFKRPSLAYIVLGTVSSATSLLLGANPVAAMQLSMEVGSVNLSSTFVRNDFQGVSFGQTYDEIPLVFALTTNQGTDPSAVRIRNVTTTGFEISQVEPPNFDGPHIDMDIQYLAITKGTHNLGGLILEAGELSTTQTIQRTPPFPNAGGFTNVPLTAGFTSTPAVLVDIQTTNNFNSGNPEPPTIPLTPWLTTTANSLTSTSFDVALERSEVNNGSPVTNPESIGYLAISQGSGNFTDDNGNLIKFAALVSDTEIPGWDDTSGATTGAEVEFGDNFGINPQVFAAKATRNGIDGGWLRRGEITPESVFLTIDEDTFFDTERLHTNEAASLLVFSDEFTLSADDEKQLIELFKLELRAGVKGAADYEGAIGPNGAQPDNTGEVQINWVNGVPVDWDLEWDQPNGEVSFTINGQTISYLSPGTAGLNFNLFELEAKALTNNNIAENTSINFIVDTLNGSPLTTPFDIEAIAPASGGVINTEEFGVFDPPILSLSGTATIAWDLGALDPTVRGRSSLTVKLIGFDPPVPASGSLSVESVPEPLTILGAGTAASFGAFFKSKLAKKQGKKKR